MKTNVYSPTWFELFLQPITPAQTEHELAFIAHWLPQPTYTTVLDVCCGMGRHAHGLSQRGYRVTGVDVNTLALGYARNQRDNVVYLERDMRELDSLPNSFDAVICLWQSFGYFDDVTNTDILRQIHRKLNPQGRLILDLYHRDFFAQHQEPRVFERGARAVNETKRMTGNRLSVRLDYGDWYDEFDWQLYTPDELCELAKRLGFESLVVCTEFDGTQAATAEQPRMQVVLEKG
jgi:SAM-dependent methyltransferase